MKKKQSLVFCSALLLLLLPWGRWLMADGFIVVPRPPHPDGLFSLAVNYHYVEVTIEDQTALTSVEQEFFNPTPYRLEGYYLFPLPAGATIQKFSMFIDGRETEAELLDAVKAREIYQDIVRRIKDPALLEYSRNGVFRVRIFPIEPHGVKKVKIAYREILRREDNVTEYLYPLNTEKFSSQLLREVRLRVEVHSASPLRSLFCPTHQVNIVRRGPAEMTAAYEARNVKPDSDFRLYYQNERKGMAFLPLCHRLADEEGFIFLSIDPGIVPVSGQVAAKDIVFVLDTSGSMAGDSLKQAKKALLFCIHNLNAGDRFDIIRFATEAESALGALGAATAENVGRTQALIANWRALGGTNIQEALSMALSRKMEKGRPFLVVFITDGKPTIGETDEDRLLAIISSANSAQTRIFTFGIGDEINTHLLDKMTEMTRAYRSYISPQEDIEVKVSNFYTKIQSPVLTDLHLRVSGSVRFSKVYPEELPDLFIGSTLTVLGRFSGAGEANVILDGSYNGQGRQFSQQVLFPAHEERNDFLGPLWATRRIGFLLDQIRLHGENKELVDEVVQLARAYGVVTPYTSFLIIEDERGRVERREMADSEQTLGGVAAAAPELEKSQRQAYDSLKEKSGAGSVAASKHVQDLHKSTVFPKMQPGEEGLVYSDATGKKQNLQQQVRYVRGSAFYRNGEFWVDARIQKTKNQQPLRIGFLSTEYFALLERQPEVAAILALGRNLRFVWQGRVYEIYAAAE